MKRTIYLFAFLLSASLSFAQQHDHSRCLTDEHYMEQIHQDPTVLERARQFEADYQKQVIAYANQTQKAPEKFIIPVVFHVFHIGGPENIPYAQIKDQIDSLNAAYNSPKFDRLRQDFYGIVGSAEIEFRLATKDPNGKCTDGVVRIYEPETENATNNIKFKSAWPTDRYFNIWVVKDINSAQSNLGTTLGYAQFPWFGGSQTDGVVIRSDNVGSIGTGANPSVGVPQWGSTLVHEAGHWLGLYHPFQDSCFGGDGVDDTPPVEAPNFGCNQSVNSCTNENPDMPDMIENYMDYANGSCMAAFTIGQKIRMHTTLKNWRPKLWLPSNLVATGTADPYTQTACAPVAYFYSLTPTVCQNGKVPFKNNSYNSSTTMTYKWEFPGGTPPNSIATTPVDIEYAQSGFYDVILIATNTVGSDTFVRKQYVSVSPAAAEYGAGFMAGFEYEIFPVDGWKTYSTSATKWTRVSTGAGSIGGSHAVFVENTPVEVGGRFYLESPAVDVSMVTDPVVSFYHAFSLRKKGAGNTTDLLSIQTSVDCGKTWTQRSLINAANLNTTGTTTPPNVFNGFFPNGPDQWEIKSIPLGIPAGQRSNVKVRFEFRSDGGHNVFLDNINIGFNTGMAEMLNEEANFSVYPNPSGGNTSIRVNMPEASEVKLEVMDMFGKTVSLVTEGNSAGGEEIFTFNPQGLSSGMYVVRLTVDGQSFTRKLMYIEGK